MTTTGRDEHVDQVLEAAKQWLVKGYLDSGQAGCGWGHYLGETSPTVWGGTLDAVRALGRLGVGPLAPMVARSVEWLRTQQRPDGGFGSREVEYSAAESTAWVVITLSELGLDSSADEAYRKAVDYLASCVDVKGGVATTPRDAADPRTLPSALVLWALSLERNHANRCGRIVERLRLSQDPTTHGWGVNAGAPATPANTAQVLVALHAASVSLETTWVREAAEFLVSKQHGDGSWRNSHDEWFTLDKPRTPFRCSHFATAWALLALTPFHINSCERAAREAAAFLVAGQRKNGSWQYDAYDPCEHVWAVTQAIVALKEWRDTSRMPHLDDSAKRQTWVVREGLAAWIWLKSTLLYLVVAGLVVAQFSSQINFAVTWLLDTAQIDVPGLWTNLVSSLVWASLVLGFGVLARRLTKR